MLDTSLTGLHFEHMGYRKHFRLHVASNLSLVYVVDRHAVPITPKSFDYNMTGNN